ncbi:MAG: type IV pilus biogenesis protein PilM [Nitrospiraceae bacterium]|nr:type IV pilus biogenesis protein PilM [Nitrospiraceae bacterium]
MWLLMAILPLGLLLGGMFLTVSQTSVPVLENANRINLEANQEATLFQLYREAVANYLDGRPGYSGTIPLSALILPAGTVIPPTFGNAVSGGVAWSWITPSASLIYSPGAVMGPEFAKSFGSLLVGVNKKGTFVSPSGISVSISVPSFVPNGAIVSFWEG